MGPTGRLVAFQTNIGEELPSAPHRLTDNIFRRLVSLSVLMEEHGIPAVAEIPKSPNACTRPPDFVTAFTENNHPLNHQSIRLVLQRVAVEICDQPLRVDADIRGGVYYINVQALVEQLGQKEQAD